MSTYILYIRPHNIGISKNFIYVKINCQTNNIPLLLSSSYLGLFAGFSNQGVL